jgi:hypothetical protein
MPIRSRIQPLCLAALVALVAGCGGSAGESSGQQASASTDVGALLKDTFHNLGKLTSATVDLKVQIDAGSQGTMGAQLSGPFESQGAGKLPKFQLAAALQAQGQDVDVGATWTGAKAFIGLQGAQYAVSDPVAKQFVTGYEQAMATNAKKNQGGLVLGGLGIDFTQWLRNARNEGDAQVGDAATIKIGGDADIARVVDDVDKIAQKASTLNVPGTSGLPQRLTPQQRAEAVAAVKSFTVTIYTGKDDRILRRLVVDAVLADTPTKTNAKIALDLTFTKVGAAQQITPPTNPKPFSELLKVTDALGGSSALGSLGLGAGKSPDATTGSSSGAESNNVDKYAACIQKAAGDVTKARKCAALLSG